MIGALQSLYGVAELSALTVVAETGDLSRFRKAPQLFSYAGMVPSEHSSAGPGNERRGAITKAGNAHRRWIVTEAAWHYLRPPKVSAERAHKSEVWRSPRPTQGKGKPRLSLPRRTDGSDQDCPVFRGECADGVQKVD